MDLEEGINEKWLKLKRRNIQVFKKAVFTVKDKHLSGSDEVF